MLVAVSGRQKSRTAQHREENVMATESVMTKEATFAGGCMKDDPDLPMLGRGDFSRPGGNETVIAATFQISSRITLASTATALSR